MLIGEIEKGKGALAHAHPGIEQICYLPEGVITSYSIHYTQLYESKARIATAAPRA